MKWLKCDDNWNGRERSLNNFKFERKEHKDVKSFTEVKKTEKSEKETLIDDRVFYLKSIDNTRLNEHYYEKDNDIINILLLSSQFSLNKAFTNVTIFIMINEIEILTVVKTTKSNLNFQAYINIIITVYFHRKKLHQVCIDTETKSMLINENIFNKSYSRCSIYFMINNKRLRCRKVENNITLTLCAKISVSFKNDREHLRIILIEIHIVFNLSCDMIVKIKLLKSN